MELKIVNQKGEAVSDVQVSENLFAVKYNQALIHQVVTAFLANARSGTRAQKNRSEIAKSTHKPHRQKGTGRARAGMASSPLWRGGGKIFPSSPDENFSHKVNRKMYRLAIASILSQLVRDNRLLVVDEVHVDTPKTKSFVSLVNNLGFDFKKQTVLFIVGEISEELYLASRNIYQIVMLEARQIDPYILMRCDNVIISKTALEVLNQQWGRLTND